MSIYVLGISAYAHEASACLLKDGRVVRFCEEERFNRERHTAAFPIQAIRWCLDSENLRLSELDQITFFWQPLKEVTGNLVHMVRYFPSSLSLLSAKGGPTDYTFAERFKKILDLRKTFAFHFPGEGVPEIYFCEHHLAHAASAFYSSPFSKGAVLTMDGRGESTTTLIARGRDIYLEKILEIQVPHSLGHFYSAVTSALGFKPFFDEWKVMGLSAYGSPRFYEEMRRLIQLAPDGFKLDLDYFSFHTQGTSCWLSKKFLKKFLTTPNPDFQLKADIAKAAQMVVEDAGVHLAKLAFKLTRERSLSLAGGVVLNCLMNRRIIEESGFDEFFFQPIANDAGTSLGAAQYWSHQIRGLGRVEPQGSVYWGPSYSDEDCLSQITQTGLSFERSDDVAVSAAELLAEGKIIGWFQGRMEAGPRALGARSILADPGVPGMKERINAIVKKRESFRPFAPSVIKEYQANYFEMPKGCDSPYMIITGRVRPEWREKLSAIVHVDGTARIQTVFRDWNPLYWSLIHEFGKRKGYSVLLNTSFNENEPIVCTPAQAIDCYRRSDLDVLVLGNYILKK